MKEFRNFTNYQFLSVKSRANCMRDRGNQIFVREKIKETGSSDMLYADEISKVEVLSRFFWLILRQSH